MKFEISFVTYNDTVPYFAPQFQVILLFWKLDIRKDDCCLLVKKNSFYTICHWGFPLNCFYFFQSVLFNKTRIMHKHDIAKFSLNKISSFLLHYNLLPWHKKTHKQLKTVSAILKKGSRNVNSLWKQENFSTVFNPFHFYLEGLMNIS